MQVTRRDSIITLRVSDNGVGMPDKIRGEGFGLRGLKERAAQLGGELQLETRPGGGSQVYLCLPIQELFP